MKNLFSFLIFFYGFGICYGANILSKPELLPENSQNIFNNTGVELLSGQNQHNSEGDFSGGRGTQMDPFKITTALQLNLIRNYPGSHFIQMSDINLGVSPWNEGKGWKPIGSSTEPFSGSFDGNGFKIENLIINTPDSSYTGLFGRAVEAVFKNIEITGADVKAKNYTGSLTGQVLGGTLSDISVSGNIIATGQFIGGIFGLVSEATINNCTSTVNASGNNFVGGIAGSGTAENCSATGKVTGVNSGGNESSGIGGLLGQGIAFNCHATGEVTGANEVGGLIGSGSAKGSYATGNITATGDYIGGLIGDMNIAAEPSDQDYEYMPGEPAAPDTSKIIKTAHSNGASPIIITLEDETRILIPANEASMDATLEKKEADIPVDESLPAGAGLRITGSMRLLKVNGSGDALPVKPVITIPASEAGSINPETINAFRFGTMYVNGELVENYSTILPVWKDENGNYKFVDALFPNGVTTDSTKSATIINQKSAELEENQKASETHWVGEVRYFLLSFDKSLNWSKKPVLERMIPDSTLINDGYRRMARTASIAKREEIAKQPICNVVILVHGHNEEEKDGFVANRINSPWEFNYKRLVWNLLYEEISKKSNKDYPTECTAFYEFIFPTYRPIFSPVPDKSGFTHKTLGEDLGNLINQEMENNPQLKAMLDNNMTFNLFLVAHSQGGLVLRAGLRFIDPKILKNLKRVITWGSPHSGAGLYTMRYALAVGHDLVIDGVRLPMQNIGQSSKYQSAVSALALDAPGIRDLRWDASKKNMLRLGELFKENTATLNEFPESELPNGTMFFSDNLRLFNENEGSFIGSYLQNKYKCFEGTTTKDAPLTLGWDVWSLSRLYHFGKNATEIEKGAQLNKLVMSSAYSASDGAVPFYSQRATGIWQGGGIEYRSVGDNDHEEFYGGENPHRNENSITKGKQVAGFTFSDMKFTDETRECPKLELTQKEENDSLYITGKLVFSLYLPTNDGDNLPGLRIKNLEARLKKADGEPIQAIAFTFKDDGTFEGKGKVMNIPEDTIFIVAVLKDESLVAEELEDKLENKIFNTTKKIWYTVIQNAINEADSANQLMVYPGTYKEALMINSKNITIQSKSGPDVTIIESSSTGNGTGFRIINCATVINGFTIKNFYQGVYIMEYNSGKSFKPVIQNNKILSSANTGIYISGKIAPKIQDNVIADSYYYGIDFDKYYIARIDENPLVSKNKISGSNRGIRVNGDIDVDIFENSIYNNEYGIEVLDKATASIQRDTITGNTNTGIRCYLTKKASEIKNNVINGNTWMGIHCESDGAFQISGNTVSNNGSGIILRLGVSVSSSAVVSKNTITGGTKGSGISIPYTTNPGNITISENTITSNNNINEGGGGISLSTSHEVSVINNIITKNKASMGGGIYVHSAGSHTISNNTISENNSGSWGGGIMIQSGANATVTGNTFSSNYATQKGGGIWGTAVGWAKTEVVTVSGKPETVTRYVPCFTETTNSYSGNSHGQTFGAWGPGVDKWCNDAGFDVYIY